MTAPAPLVCATDLVDATGTRRRLQALVVHGWTQAKLAARLGRTEWAVRQLVHADVVPVTTRDQVTALFDDLWCVKPVLATVSERSASTRSSAVARARGWMPALAWDDIDTDPTPPKVDRDPAYIDEIAIALAVDGARPHLTPREREECVRILHAKEWPDTLIAVTLGCAERTVFRIRQRLELPANEHNSGVGRWWNAA